VNKVRRLIVFTRETEALCKSLLRVTVSTPTTALGVDLLGNQLKKLFPGRPGMGAESNRKIPNAQGDGEQAIRLKVCF
jgi:hypothetical protein